MLPVGGVRTAVFVKGLDFDTHIDCRGVLLSGKGEFFGCRCARGNLEVVFCPGGKPGEFCFVEEYGAPFRHLRLIECGGLSVIHDAVGAAAAPPVNLCTSVVHLANRYAADIDRFERHRERVPLAMVVVGRHVVLCVHAFQEEIIDLAGDKPVEREGATLGSLVLLDGLGRILVRCGVVEYRGQGYFIGVPADDCRGVRNRYAGDVAVQRALGVNWKLVGKALRGHQQLDGEIDAGLCLGIVSPVVL